MSAVFNNQDLLRAIFGSARGDEFLFFGTINRASHRAYPDSNTRYSSCFETVSRFKESGMQSLCSHLMKYGSTDVMRYALDAGIVNNVNEALEHAIRRADVNQISTIYTEFNESRIGPACLIAAVESGSLALVQQYCADGVLDYSAPNFGLRDNHCYPFPSKGKIIICRNWKTYLGDYLVDAAKRGGFLDILKWLHAQNMPSVEEMSETHDIIGEAAAHGNREMVEWMLQAGYHPSADEIPHACHSNDVSFLEWLEQKGCMILPNKPVKCKNTDPAVIAWLTLKGFKVNG